MQFSPWSIFLPFRSKYPPQHSGKITVLHILILCVLIWDRKTKDFGQNNSRYSQTQSIFIKFVFPMCCLVMRVFVD
jgi:hypothetical protein